MKRVLLNFVKKFDIPLLTFSAKTLSAVEGEFTTSEFVKKDCRSRQCVRKSGLRGRCENKQEKKTALNGTALALGRINTEIDFLKG